jgi:hypothetical protein
MTDEIVTLLKEIKGDLVSLNTEIILMKFAVEKIEKQVEELHENQQQGSMGGNDPFGGMPGITIEKF